MKGTSNTTNAANVIVMNLFDQGIFANNCGLTGHGSRNLATGHCFNNNELAMIEDLRLGALADNGGKTKTMAPHFKSPAIGERYIAHDQCKPNIFRNGRGTALQVPTTDQTGRTRPMDCDYGAVEYDSSNDVFVYRRHLQGLQEPRIAFVDPTGYAQTQLGPYTMNQVEVVYLKGVQTPTAFECQGLLGGTLGWMDKTNNYAVLNRDNPDSQFPTYSCPIWLKPTN